jgi:hypothetical protein
MGKRKSVLIGVFGVVGTIITTFIAFLLFLGGISGLGNEDLFTLALIVVALPVILPTLFGLLYLLSKLRLEGGRPKDATPSQRAPRKPLNFRLIARRIGSGLIVIAVGAAVFLAYDYISTREPALIRAITAGNVPKVSTLLAEGEDPNQLSRRGATPLMMALFQENPPGNELAILLLEHGADPNRPSHSGQRRAKLYDMTPIVRVVKDFDEALSADVFTLMLEKGVNVNPAPARPNELSPLMMALRSSSGTAGPLTVLLEAGARLDLERDSIHSLLVFSAENRDDRLVRMLIDEDTDGSKLEQAVSLVNDSFRRLNDCEHYYSNLARLLKEEINKRTGEVVYPESAMLCVDR